MKLATLVLAATLATVVAPDVQAQDAKPPQAAPLPEALKDPKAQAGYALGLNIGYGLRRDGIELDSQMLAQGVKDALTSAPPQMSPDQVRAVLSQLQAGIQSRAAQQAAQAAETNKAQGAAFLKANSAKPGVISLPSGLQYEILTAGAGPKPKADDTVSCNYRGTLLNNTEFDSSYRRGTPTSFPVSGVIKGWTEALQLMPVGSKWRLVVPAELAYGDKGAGPEIGPNSVLIFEIELLAIESKD